MIKGLGIDTIEISRIKKAYSERFLKKVATRAECQVISRLPRSRQIQRLAGMFSLKEAYSKALGCGISKDCGFHDLETSQTKLGAPKIKYVGKIKKYLKLKAHCSITHDGDLVITVVVLE